MNTPGVRLYRKRPVVIEAIQWTGDNQAEIADFIGKGPRYDGPGFGSNTQGDAWVLVDTLEGTMTAHKGWWIIKGIHGEFYPCEPEIFVKTYDLVQDFPGKMGAMP